MLVDLAVKKKNGTLHKQKIYDIAMLEICAFTMRKPAYVAVEENDDLDDYFDDDDFDDDDGDFDNDDFDDFDDDFNEEGDSCGDENDSGDDGFNGSGIYKVIAINTTDNLIAVEIEKWRYYNLSVPFCSEVVSIFAER